MQARAGIVSDERIGPTGQRHVVAQVGDRFTEVHRRQLVAHSDPLIERSVMSNSTLCVRGTARAFCIGCPFLVRRPEYADRVDFFLNGYLEAAKAHEHMGDLAGARERHRLIAQLKQLRSEMLLLAEAEQQGRWTPSWQQAPPLPAASV